MGESMSKEEKHDVSQPILIVVRKGRGGRGFLVSAVDKLNDISPCQDKEEMADAIIEMLEDEDQPRVDLNELQRAASEGDDKERALDESEQEEEDEEEEDGEDDAHSNDEVQDFVTDILAGVINRARKASRTSSGRGRRRKRK